MLTSYFFKATSYNKLIQKPFKVLSSILDLTCLICSLYALNWYQRLLKAFHKIHIVLLTKILDLLSSLSRRITSFLISLAWRIHSDYLSLFCLYLHMGNTYVYFRPHIPNVTVKQNFPPSFVWQTNAFKDVKGLNIVSFSTGQSSPWVVCSHEVDSIFIYLIYLNT